MENDAALGSEVVDYVTEPVFKHGIYTSNQLLCQIESSFMPEINPARITTFASPKDIVWLLLVNHVI